jgi:hypothetical protein
MSNLIIASSTYKNTPALAALEIQKKLYVFLNRHGCKGFYTFFYEILAYIADVIQYNIGL